MTKALTDDVIYLAFHLVRTEWHASFGLCPRIYKTPQGAVKAAGRGGLVLKVDTKCQPEVSVEIMPERWKVKDPKAYADALLQRRFEQADREFQKWFAIRTALAEEIERGGTPAEVRETFPIEGLIVVNGWGSDSTGENMHRHVDVLVQHHDQWLRVYRETAGALLDCNINHCVHLAGLERGKLVKVPGIVSVGDEE